MSPEVLEAQAAVTLPPREHESLFKLERALLDFPQADMPVTHEHCDGLYARTIHLKADQILTGAIHQHECFFLVRSGFILVTTDDGERLLKAGDMVVSRAGSKRAGVALVDTVVTTFHPNPSGERDPVRLWDQYVVAMPARQIGGA